MSINGCSNGSGTTAIRVVPTVTAISTTPTAAAQKSSILVLTHASLNELLNSSDLNIMNNNNNTNSSGAGSNEWKSCGGRQLDERHDEDAFDEGEEDADDDEEEEEAEEEERPSNTIVHIMHNRNSHIYPTRNHVTSHNYCSNQDDLIGGASATTNATTYNILQPSKIAANSSNSNSTSSRHINHINQDHTSINNHHNNNNHPNIITMRNNNNNNHHFTTNTSTTNKLNPLKTVLMINSTSVSSVLSTLNHATSAPPIIVGQNVTPMLTETNAITTTTVSEGELSSSSVQSQFPIEREPIDFSIIRCLPINRCDRHRILRALSVVCINTRT